MTSSAKPAKPMFFGLDLHSWEQWSIVFLAIVAFGGVGALTLIIVIRSRWYR